MGLGNEVCRSLTKLTTTLGRIMDFNAELWEERFAAVKVRNDKQDEVLEALRIALFGNGKKDECISEQVRENTRFRKEMEQMLHAIRNDLVKKMAWALVVVTVVLLSGFGGILYAILATAK